MTQTSAVADAPLTPEQQRKAKKATAVSAFGTFIEYYDFSVYGYVAATLAVVFFPSDDPTVGLLNTLLVFGLAFLVRPIGAVFFGRLGDRVGRRTALVASIGTMTVAAAGTGLLPGYATIGIAAPILLVLLRMLQGFSTGGEIGGAASYIREWAPPTRRAFYIAFVPSFAQVGKAGAAAMAALAASLLPDAAMESWGWRIPFLLAVPLGVLVLYLRLKIEDSPEFTAAKAHHETTKSPFKELVTVHRAQLLKVIMISTVQNVGTYIGTVFIAVYLATVLGFSKGEAATIVLYAVLAAAVVIPFMGLLGGRIGAKRVLLISYAAYAIVTIPSFLLMGQGSYTIAIFGLMLGMVPYVMCQAGTYASMPELFPVEVRYSGVAFGHSTGAVIGGGLGPYAATWLIDATGNNLMPGFILVAFGILGFLVISTTVRKAPADLSQAYT
jgi:MHS family proline/betaine transporter-like MFS transporter